MPHIHEKIDFTVAAYIINSGDLLLVNHLQLKSWLPVGGHIELDQDPEEALFNEIGEETGLLPNQLELLTQKTNEQFPNIKFLPVPNFFDIHDITDAHRHVGIGYVIRSRAREVVLAEKEHSDIRWFTAQELEDPSLNIFKSTRYYARRALDIETNYK